MEEGERDTSEQSGKQLGDHVANLACQGYGGFQKLGGIVLEAIFWGPPILGNYHMMTIRDERTSRKAIRQVKAHLRRGFRV